MQITKVDKEKRLLQLAMWWFKKKYKGRGNTEEIEEDIKHCGNPIIRIIHEEMLRGLDSIDVDAKHQRDVPKDVGEFLLWILYRDTAYRQPAFYILKNILDRKEEIMKYMDKYYDEPESWYANRWRESKRATKEQVEKGEIPEGYMSESETYFTPEIQAQRFQQIEKELMKQKKTRRKLLRD